MKPPRITVDLRIASIYAVFGGMWILFSDSLLAAFVTDPETITRIQTYKGWGFVAASALIIFLLLRRELKGRSLTEKELVESQTQLSGMVDHAMDAIISLDEDQRIVLFNPAAERMFGCPAAEALGGPLDRFLPQRYREIHPRHIRTFGDAGKTSRSMAKLNSLVGLRADGTEFPVEVAISQVELGGRKLYTAVVRDITENRRVMEALEKAEEKYRSIFENAVEGIFQSTPEGRFLTVNPAFAHMLGYETPEELIATVTDIGSQIYADSQRRAEFARLMAEQGSLTGFEFEMRRKDGRRIWVSESVRAVRDGSGTIQFFEGTTEDITGRKNAQEEIRRRAGEFAALYDTARDLAAYHDPPGLLRAIVERTRALLGTPAGGVYLYDPERGDLEMSLTIGMPIPVGARLQLGEGMAGRVAQTRQPLIVDDYSTWEGRSPQYKGIPIKAVAQVPMLYAGQLIGVLAVDEDPASDRKFTQADLHILMLLAEYAASSIHSTRLYEKAQQEIAERKQAEEALARRAEELHILQATLLELTAPHKLQNLLQTIVARAAHLLTADSGGLYLSSPERREVQCVVSYKTLRDYTGVTLKYGEGAAGLVAQTGEALIVNDYRIWSGRAVVYDEERPFERLVSAPMYWHGQLTGVIHVLRSFDDPPFSAADLELLSLFANHAAIAVANAQQVEKLQTELTERKQAVAALREAETRYRTLVEQLPNMVTYIDSADPSIGIVYISPQIEEMLGYTPEEWQADPFLWHNSIHPEDREQVLAEDKRHDETGNTVTLEYRIAAKGGRVVWVYDEAVMLRDESGKPLYSQGIMIDITERKLAEVALRESERRYRALFEQSHDAMFILDLQGNHLVANQRAAEMLGYTSEEMIGLSFQATSAEPEQSAGVMKRLLGGEQIPLYERIFRKKNGELIPVEINAELIRDMYGNPLHIQSAVRDISERKRAEQALRGSEEKLRLFVEHVPVVLAMLDHDMRYIAVSRRLITDYKLEETDLTGKSHYEVFPDIPERWKEIHQRGLAGEVIRSEEDEFIRMDGSVQWLRWEVLPWYTTDDEIGGIVIFTEEISERKRADMELRRYAQNTAAMYELSQRMLTSSNLELIYASAHQAVEKMMPCDAFIVALLDEKKQEIEDAYLWDLDRRWPSERHPVSQAQLTTYIISEAKPLLVNRWNESHDRVTGTVSFGYTELDTQSVLAVPLFHTSGECFGMISAQAYPPDAYTGEHLQLLATVASQISETIENVRLVSDLQKSNMELSLAYDATIEGWSHAMDLRDKETEGHTQRVTRLTIELARQMGVSEPEIVQIRRGALLHDIGKLGVPDIILLKSDMLTTEEWEVMRKHPQFAYEMLVGIDYLKDALDIPLCHHERWDGKGYPRGLKGEEIPLAARIFTIMDVWDAITTDRPYRRGWSKDAAIQHIRSESGKQFDPIVVENFLALNLHGK